MITEGGRGRGTHLKKGHTGEAREKELTDEKGGSGRERE